MAFGIQTSLDREQIRFTVSSIKRDASVQYSKSRSLISSFYRDLTFVAASGITPTEEPQIFSAHVESLSSCEPLRTRVLDVLSQLPEVVQRDFLDDSRFRIALENYVPGEGWSLWMATPGPIGSGSRCVVLRRRLAECSEEFAYYVIAHEFAHAFLRNGGWGAITDIEEAADALAASWGFVRPAEGYRRV